MNLDNTDNEYKLIVNRILTDNEFNRLKDIEHHGVNRYDHSLKVSYYSYKIAKVLKLNYKEVAKAGLLHDFFLSDNERSTKDRIVSVFNHSNIAVQNSVEHFNISKKEADIIKSHMFPIGLSIPKYAESWVVNLVDKSVAIQEFSKKYRYRLSYASNFIFITLLNMIKF